MRQLCCQIQPRLKWVRPPSAPLGVRKSLVKANNDSHTDVTKALAQLIQYIPTPLQRCIKRIFAVKLACKKNMLTYDLK